VLKHVKRDLMLHDAIQHGPAIPLTVVRSVDEVAADLHRLNQVLPQGGTMQRSVSTFDIEALFTSIPHDDLKRRLSSLLEMVWRPNHLLEIHRDERQTRWVSQDSATEVPEAPEAPAATKALCASAIRMTRGDVDELIETVVGDTVIDLLGGGATMRQHAGIPMGTNAGPQMADLYLYSYERAFFTSRRRMASLSLPPASHTRLPSALRQVISSPPSSPAAADDPVSALPLPGRLYRYMDDLLAVGMPSAPSLLKHIYPQWLTIKDTTDEADPPRATYLGMSVEVECAADGGWRILLDVGKKQLAFPFELVKSTDALMASCVPDAWRWAGWMSRCDRTLAVCQTHQDVFMDRLAELRELMRGEGLDSGRVDELCRHYVSKYTRRRAAWARQLQMDR